MIYVQFTSVHTEGALDPICKIYSTDCFALFSFIWTGGSIREEAIIIEYIDSWTFCLINGIKFSLSLKVNTGKIRYFSIINVIDSRVWKSVYV